jgi:hypothetical protein
VIQGKIVNAFPFLKFKQNLELNSSFDQITQIRHAAVRSALASTGAAIKETKLIGSLQRQTRIQPRLGDEFDIDILVVLGEFYNWLPVGDPNGVTPDRALNYVYGAVEGSDRYSTKNPAHDAPTVALQFADKIKVELVPAFLDMIGQSPGGATHSPVGRGYWVPKNGRWELADYDFESSHITERNKASGGYLIPTIKMFKAAKRIHFAALKSFPLEILAAQAIPAIMNSYKKNNHAVTYPDLIKLFFVLAKDWCAQPLKIPGSNSPSIVLGPRTVESLRTIFDNIIAHVENIERMPNERQKIEAWRMLFCRVDRAWPSDACA